ncbi:MAG: Vacuolar protein sorting-associated protein 4 [Chaenotheca gracillima]|nr:MAG: Vacuolar protein sorting-associated protein 4 [Chaenotheca gracillima]
MTINAPAVQAQSLASLTALASNPPRYPRNPTQETRERLVLYIARVPGSRDVFLSTMKPGKDVVTAQDVASSIFYLHVNQPGDEELGDDLQRHQESVQGESHEKKQPEVQVSRKPVPGVGSEQQSPISPTDGSRPQLPIRPSVTSNPYSAVTPALESELGQSENSSPVSPRAGLRPELPARPSVTEHPPIIGMEHVGRKPVTGPIPRSLDSSLKTDHDTAPRSAPGVLEFSGNGDSGSESPRRRPLGPRQENNRPQSVASPITGVENMPLNGRARAATADSGDRPPLPPRSSILSAGNVLRNPAPPSISQDSPRGVWTRNRPPHSNNNPSFTSTSYDSTHAAGSTSTPIYGSYSITLIRRDLASGAQWNVGRIYIRPDQDVETQLSRYSISSPDPVKTTGSSRSIDIEINNPGYSKFLDASLPAIESLLQAGDRSSISTIKDFASLASSQTTSTAAPRDGIFRREVELETSPSRSRGFRKSSLGSKDWSGDGNPFRKSSHGLGDGPRTGFKRRSLQESASSEDVESSASQGHSQSQSESSSRRKTRGYSFRSPWNGRCEFTTGVAGRSLKCKHTLPSSNTSESAPAITISELRFNLPSLTKFPSSSSNIPTTTSSSNTSPPPTSNPSLLTTRSHRISKQLFSHHHHHSHTDSALSSSSVVYPDYDSNDEDRLDLSLGQEKAGGGHRGNSAKLGKLIVEDEGLRMLDLVVAANMGVWWTVYEKAGRRVS